ncbi:MAG: hypothetical protein AB1938_03565 [Myxococcota bacterium]
MSRMSGVPTSRRVAIAVFVVVTPLMVYGLAQERKFRREVKAAESFVTQARARAQTLRTDQSAEFRCDAPLKSLHPGKAFFGSADFAALFVDPTGKGLPWDGAPGELIIGNGDCVRRVSEVMAWQEKANAVSRVAEVLKSPSSLRYALDDVTLPICMSTHLTDFGVVVVPELTASEDGTLAGQWRVEVFEFPDGRVRCRGSAEVTLPAPGDKKSDRARARQFSDLVTQLLAKAGPT